ncbi:hypothetical protein NDU88_001949 [Pleurodeles waltl]|uniref:Uncharacterized protein n=1 Tax=Pleurodeles waltl TaxID=8319 RepID=A0AAV7UAW9_PLEWA|nr:hypothetical protein NDU88_001949 [Pleurodeles waltl]
MGRRPEWSSSAWAQLCGCDIECRGRVCGPPLGHARSGSRPLETGVAAVCGRRGPAMLVLFGWPGSGPAGYTTPGREWRSAEPLGWVAGGWISAGGSGWDRSEA